jgi:hypothetical protein
MDLLLIKIATLSGNLLATFNILFKVENKIGILSGEENEDGILSGVEGGFR